MKIQDTLFTAIGVLLVSKVEVLVDNTEELLEEEERERTTPIAAFDCGFLTQENADTFPILICRDNRHGQTGATCCERKGPRAYSISLLAGFIKDLDFSRIILKYENEPSMKAFQEVMIHSCVEVAVRETKRQCRILRISAEHNKSVSITDDISLLNFYSSFRNAILEQNENWSKMEIFVGHQEQFHTLPRVELCEAKVRQVRS